jgi:PAS domain-containing protein
MVSLRSLLTIPFILQTVGIVGLVGYLSDRSGQEAIADLAHQLMETTAEQVDIRLDQFLQQPQRLLSLNKLAVERGTLDLNDWEGLYELFWQQNQFFDSLTGIEYASSTGEFIGVGRERNGTISHPDALLKVEFQGKAPGTLKYFLVDELGKVQKLLHTVPNWDARKRPWYQQAVEQNRQTWTTVYPFVGFPLAATNAVVPVYQGGELRGIFQSTVILSHISQFLEQLDFSPNGQVFIMERSGDLIASSSGEDVYLVSGTPEQRQLMRVNILNSSNPIIQEIGQALQREFKSWEQIKTVHSFEFVKPHSSKLQNNNVLQRFIRPQAQYFGEIIPYQDQYGLDWLIVTVVPASDFMGEIDANVHRTILLCGLALMGSLGIGIITAQYLTRPLVNLSQAAQELAEGNLKQRLPVSSVTEVEAVSHSFQTMASQLSHYFADLKNSEQKFSTFLDSVPVGVSVFDGSGKRLLMNRKGQEILQSGHIDTNLSNFSNAYQIYLRQTQELYPHEQLPLMRAMRGEIVYADDLDLIRTDEETGEKRRIPLEVYGTPVKDEAGKIIYVITAYQDITERRQAEQLSRNYQQDLEHQVAEKTVALTEAQRIAGVGSWEYDLIANEVIWSNQLYRIYEAEDQAPVARPDLYIQQIHPSDQQRFQQTVVKAVKAAQSFDTDLTIITQTGKTRYIQAKGQPIFNAEGQMVKFVGTIANITERKQAELALKASEAKFYTLFHRNPAPSCIATLAEGRYLAVNHQFTQFYGTHIPHFVL